MRKLTRNLDKWVLTSLFQLELGNLSIDNFPNQSFSKCYHIPGLAPPVQCKSVEQIRCVPAHMNLKPKLTKQCPSG